MIRSPHNEGQRRPQVGTVFLLKSWPTGVASSLLSWTPQNQARPVRQTRELRNVLGGCLTAVSFRAKSALS
jgi:hypothetical protein